MLLDKKYALPYRVIDELVFHFVRFERDERTLPVLWHQALLVFVQRYKQDMTDEQKDALRRLLKTQSHPGISPEILRELIESKSRDAGELSNRLAATAGGLVFSGEEDGHLDAHDAETGKILWRFQCGAGISGPAITYALDGRQYVAVAAGGASFTKGAGFGTGDALVVFALPE